MKEHNDINSVWDDQDFISSLLELEEPEQVQAAFAEKGIELSLDEVKGLGQLIDLAIRSGGELTEKNLDEVAGGTIYGYGDQARKQIEKEMRENLERELKKRMQEGGYEKPNINW